MIFGHFESSLTVFDGFLKEKTVSGGVLGVDDEDNTVSCESFGVDR